MKNLMPLGTKAPDSKLPDVTSGTEYTLKNFAGKKALMVIFICRHCPYVQHVKKALEAFLAGQPVSADQKPAIGCSIKWKS